MHLPSCCLPGVGDNPIPSHLTLLFDSPDISDNVDVFGKLLPFLPQRQVRFHRIRHLRENGILSGFPIHSQGVRWGPCLGRQWLTLVACSLTFACFSFRPSTLKTVTTVYKACVKEVFQFFVLNIEESGLEFPVLSHHSFSYLFPFHHRFHPLHPSRGI